MHLRALILPSSYPLIPLGAGGGKQDLYPAAICDQEANRLRRHASAVLHDTYHNIGLQVCFWSPWGKIKGFNLPADPCTEEIEIEIEAAEFLLEAGTIPVAARVW